MSEEEKQRLSKIMSQRGLCSRREAEKLIVAGQVEVNGNVLDTLGVKVSPDAVIQILEGGKRALGAKVTVMLNKPPGIISQLPQGDQHEASELLTGDRCAEKLDASLLRQIESEAQSFSVAGRLDLASRGLLILTQDGRVVKAITGGSGLEKVYEVEVDGDVSENQLKRLNGRLSLEGEELLPMQVKRLAKRKMEFHLREGKKHQIRKVCRKVGFQVVDLFRIRIGDLNLLGLKEGFWKLADLSCLGIEIKKT